MIFSMEVQEAQEHTRLTVTTEMIFSMEAQEEAQEHTRLTVVTEMMFCTSVCQT